MNIYQKFYQQAILNFQTFVHLDYGTLYISETWFSRYFWQ